MPLIEELSGISPTLPRQANPDTISLYTPTLEERRESNSVSVDNERETDISSDRASLQPLIQGETVPYEPFEPGEPSRNSFTKWRSQFLKEMRRAFYGERESLREGIKQEALTEHQQAIREINQKSRPLVEWYRSYRDFYEEVKSEFTQVEKRVDGRIKEYISLHPYHVENAECWMLISATAKLEELRKSVTSVINGESKWRLPANFVELAEKTKTAVEDHLTTFDGAAAKMEQVLDLRESSKARGRLDDIESTISEAEGALEIIEIAKLNYVDVNNKLNDLSKNIDRLSNEVNERLANIQRLSDEVNERLDQSYS